MLTDLVEVRQGVLQSLDQSGHATKRRSLELFALEQTLRVLQQPDVISRDGLDQVLGRRNLAKSHLEMILVVEDVQEGGCERVEVVKDGETLDDVAEFFAACFLGEFDLGDDMS